MTIDIHGHVTSPELFRRFPMPPSLADIAGMVGKKAALGISTTIVGSPVGSGTMVPFPGLDNYAQPVDQLESFHEWVAGTVRTHWPSLRGYVYVNPLTDDGWYERAAKWLTQPEFVGVITNTSVRGQYLDAPAAADFFGLVADADVPVLLHPPAEPAAGAGIDDLGLLEHVARPCDITIGVAAVLLAGWLERYPGVRLIAPNAGGSLALLAEKLDLAHQRSRAGGPPGRTSSVVRGQLTAPPSTTLRRVLVDSATPSRAALTAALSVFGPGNLLFGTDSPPLTAPLDDALNLVGGLGLDGEALSWVLEGHARALFRIPPLETT